jgi:hydroxyacylglutathione hydrolase
MIKFEEFTGGMLDTNCFLIRGPGGNVLIDAPQGADQRFAGDRIDALLLTHGHFDHVADAAAIVRRHGCEVHYHPDTAPMVTDPDFYRNWSFALEVEPVAGGKLLVETPAFEVAGLRCAVLEVPGHCPGSLCFYFAEDGVLFGGDVLFRSGVGRSDLPGGDWELLQQGIFTKIFPLPDDTAVFPGHGPATTVGFERATNPYLQS